jgi:myo-inositol 2-dehydrogenase / D-chiro-inositol 1-dehydrogenase
MLELKIGIIGCGRMGRERARCVHTLGAQVSVVVDTETARADALARDYQARVVESAAEALDSGLDALFICTAPGVRRGLEAKCAEGGLPFLVEKPLGTSLQACVPVLHALEHHPVVHAVGYMNRYRESVRIARRVLAGTEVIGLAAHWVGRRYQVPWWEDVSCSGGPFNEQATHLFDLSRFLLGDIAKVQAFFHGNGQAAIAAQFRSGVPGTLFYSCDGREKDIALRVFTRDGSLALTTWEFQLAENAVTGELMTDPEDVFLKETQVFLEAVRTKNQELIASDYADAAATQSTMDQARQSSS